MAGPNVYWSAGGAGGDEPRTKTPRSKSRVSASQCADAKWAITESERTYNVLSSKSSGSQEETFASQKKTPDTYPSPYPIPIEMVLIGNKTGQAMTVSDPVPLGWEIWPWSGEGSGKYSRQIENSSIQRPILAKSGMTEDAYETMEKTTYSWAPMKFSDILFTSLGGLTSDDVLASYMSGKLQEHLKQQASAGAEQATVLEAAKTFIRDNLLTPDWMAQEIRSDNAGHDALTKQLLDSYSTFRTRENELAAQNTDKLQDGKLPIEFNFIDKLASQIRVVSGANFSILLSSSQISSLQKGVLDPAANFIWDGNVKRSTQTASAVQDITGLDSEWFVYCSPVKKEGGSLVWLSAQEAREQLVPQLKRWISLIEQVAANPTERSELDAKLRTAMGWAADYSTDDYYSGSLKLAKEQLGGIILRLEKADFGTINDVYQDYIILMHRMSASRYYVDDDEFHDSKSSISSGVPSASDPLIKNGKFVVYDGEVGAHKLMQDALDKLSVYRGGNVVVPSIPYLTFDSQVQIQDKDGSWATPDKGRPHQGSNSSSPVLDQQPTHFTLLGDWQVAVHSALIRDPQVDQVRLETQLRNANSSEGGPIKDYAAADPSKPFISDPATGQPKVFNYGAFTFDGVDYADGIFHVKGRRDVDIIAKENGKTAPLKYDALSSIYPAFFIPKGLASDAGIEMVYACRPFTGTARLKSSTEKIQYGSGFDVYSNWMKSSIRGLPYPDQIGWRRSISANSYANAAELLDMKKLQDPRNAYDFSFWKDDLTLKVPTSVLREAFNTKLWELSGGVPPRLADLNKLLSAKDADGKTEIDRMVKDAFGNSVSELDDRFGMGQITLAHFKAAALIALSGNLDSQVAARISDVVGKTGRSYDDCKKMLLDKNSPYYDSTFAALVKDDEDANTQLFAARKSIGNAISAVVITSPGKANLFAGFVDDLITNFIDSLDQSAILGFKYSYAWEQGVDKDNKKSVWKPGGQLAVQISGVVPWNGAVPTATAPDLDGLTFSIDNIYAAIVKAKAKLSWDLGEYLGQNSVSVALNLQFALMWPTGVETGIWDAAADRAFSGAYNPAKGTYGLLGIEAGIRGIKALWDEMEAMRDPKSPTYDKNYRSNPKYIDDLAALAALKNDLRISLEGNGLPPSDPRYWQGLESIFKNKTWADRSGTHTGDYEGLGYCDSIRRYAGLPPYDNLTPDGKIGNFGLINGVINHLIELVGTMGADGKVSGGQPRYNGKATSATRIRVGTYSISGQNEFDNTSTKGPFVLDEAIVGTGKNYRGPIPVGMGNVTIHFDLLRDGDVRNLQIDLQAKPGSKVEGKIVGNFFDVFAGLPENPNYQSLIVWDAYLKYQQQIFERLVLLADMHFGNVLGGPALKQVRLTLDSQPLGGEWGLNMSAYGALQAPFGGTYVPTLGVDASESLDKLAKKLGLGLGDLAASVGASYNYTILPHGKNEGSLFGSPSLSNFYPYFRLTYAVTAPKTAEVSEREIFEQQKKENAKAQKFIDENNKRNPAPAPEPAPLKRTQPLQSEQPADKGVKKAKKEEKAAGKTQTPSVKTATPGRTSARAPGALEGEFVPFGKERASGVFIGKKPVEKKEKKEEKKAEKKEEKKEDKPAPKEEKKEENAPAQKEEKKESKPATKEEQKAPKTEEKKEESQKEEKKEEKPKEKNWWEEEEKPKKK